MKAPYTRDGVLEDCPRPRVQLEDKKSWHGLGLDSVLEHIPALSTHGQATVAKRTSFYFFVGIFNILNLFKVFDSPLRFDMPYVSLFPAAAENS